MLERGLVCHILHILLVERLQGIKNASTVLAGRQILLSLKFDLFAREWAQVG